MRLKKALNGYYRERVKAVSPRVDGLKMTPRMQAGGSLVFPVIFHAALVIFMLTAMLLGQYRPSPLNRQIGIFIYRYNIEDRMIESLERLNIFFKENNTNGGKI